MKNSFSRFSYTVVLAMVLSMLFAAMVIRFYDPVLEYIENFQEAEIVSAINTSLEQTTNLGCKVSCTNGKTPHISSLLHGRTIRELKCIKQVDTTFTMSKLFKLSRRVAQSVKKFDSDCKTKGSLRKLTFIEQLSGGDSTFISVTIDTTTCGIMRIGNACEFYKNSDWLKKQRK